MTNLPFCDDSVGSTDNSVTDRIGIECVEDELSVSDNIISLTFNDHFTASNNLTCPEEASSDNESDSTSISDTSINLDYITDHVLRSLAGLPLICAPLSIIDVQNTLRSFTSNPPKEHVLRARSYPG